MHVMTWGSYRDYYRPQEPRMRKIAPNALRVRDEFLHSFGNDCIVAFFDIDCNQISPERTVYEWVDVEEPTAMYPNFFEGKEIYEFTYDKRSNTLNISLENEYEVYIDD